MSNLTNPINNFHLVIQTNSPGELASWVTPIVQRVASEHPFVYITLCLVPCQYASGEEHVAAQHIKGIHQILRPKQTVLYCLGKSRLLKKQSQKGAVLCLGGDPFYAQWLSFRLGFCATIYTEHNRKPGFFFKNIFYKDRDGDLMQSRIRDYLISPPDVYSKYKLPKRKYILFCLGSRAKHFELFSEFCIAMFDLFLNKQSEFDILVSISPTISTSMKASFESRVRKDRVYTFQRNSLDLMHVSDFMVSLPGTNTAEAMYMGLPMLTVLPLNRVDKMDIDGLLGLVFKFPILGTYLKRLIIPSLIKRVQFVSLPNKRAKRLIVPEIIDSIFPESFTKILINTVSNKANLKKIKDELSNISTTNHIDKDIIDRILL